MCAQGPAGQRTHRESAEQARLIMHRCLPPAKTIPSTPSPSPLLLCLLHCSGFQQLVKATAGRGGAGVQAFAVRLALATVAVAAWRLVAWCSAFRRGDAAGATRAGPPAGRCLRASLRASTWPAVQPPRRGSLCIDASPFWRQLLPPRFIPGERLQGWRMADLAAGLCGRGLALGDVAGWATPARRRRKAAGICRGWLQAPDVGADHWLWSSGTSP